MDNDNKIEANELTSAQRHKDVLLFLNKELDNLQMHSGTASTYNLEKEYAKTKKNKSPFVFFMILACVLFTVGIAFILRYTINKQNQSIEINLEEFDSLNLKALLDSVTKVQDKYDNAVKKRDQAIAQMENEIKILKAACGDKILKVIIETCFLTDEEKIKMCEIVTSAGADYIKTSTGFGGAGATFADIELFAKHIGPNVKMKVAGGISSIDDAEKFLALGADRLGTSRIVKIVKNEEATGY